MDEKKHDPSQNCYCGGPEEIYPHVYGTGYYCKREVKTAPDWAALVDAYLAEKLAEISDER